MGEGRQAVRDTAGPGGPAKQGNTTTEIRSIQAHWALAASAHWCKIAPFSMSSAARSLCSGNLIDPPHLPATTVNARAAANCPSMHVYAYALQGVARAVARRYVLRLVCTALNEWP